MRARGPTRSARDFATPPTAPTRGSAPRWPSTSPDPSCANRRGRGSGVLRGVPRRRRLTQLEETPVHGSLHRGERREGVLRLIVELVRIRLHVVELLLARLIL